MCVCTYISMCPSCQRATKRRCTANSAAWRSKRTDTGTAETTDVDTTESLDTTESIDTTDTTDVDAADTTTNRVFSRPHVPTLPAELLHMIVGHLRDDRASLRCCALAARELLHPARTHLFSRLHLDTRTLVARNEDGTECTENEGTGDEGTGNGRTDNERTGNAPTENAPTENERTDNERTEDGRTENAQTENAPTDNARTDNSQKSKRRRRRERKVNFAQFSRYLSVRPAPPMSMARYIRAIDLVIDFKVLMKPGSSLAFLPDGCPALRSLSLRDSVASSKRRHSLAPPPPPRVRPDTPPRTLTSMWPLPSLCITPGSKCGVPCILHILSCFASVRELHLELQSLRAGHYKTVPALPGEFGVESLIIGGPRADGDVPAVYDLCRALCAGRTAQSLRCFRVQVRNDMYCALIREVFVADCASLTEVALDLTRNTDTVFGTRRTVSFPALSDIPVTSVLLTDKPLWGTVYEWNLDPVLAFLLVSPPTLSHLHIKTHSPPGGTDPSAAEYAKSVNWSAMRDRLRALKNLRRVVFEPEFGWGWVGGRGFFSDLREIVERELAASVPSGTIEVFDGPQW